MNEKLGLHNVVVTVCNKNSQNVLLIKLICYFFCYIFNQTFGLHLHTLCSVQQAYYYSKFD